MAGKSFSGQRRQNTMADMNVVPLVDVMLVLLVIFIITAPLLTHSVKIDLPKATSLPNITQPDHIEFAIKKDGELYWNGVPVTLDETSRRFSTEASRQPQPELHIHADRLTYYENVAKVMAIAAKSGLSRIGFVSDPRETEETKND